MERSSLQTLKTWSLANMTGGTGQEMRVLIVLALATASLGAPVPAQALDGTYAGFINCEAIPGTTQRPLRSSLTLRVSGTSATYEREMRATKGDQPTGQFERGKGTVTPAGAITLSGSGQNEGSQVHATYTGTVSGGTARLSGTQTWSRTGERKCTIEARIAR
jgi:hypothetical protein